MNARMPCSTFWITAEPDVVLSLPCEDGQVTVWRCRVCNGWHGVWPKEETKVVIEPTDQPVIRNKKQRTKNAGTHSRLIRRYYTGYR